MYFYYIKYFVSKIVLLKITNNVKENYGCLLNQKRYFFKLGNNLPKKMCICSWQKNAGLTIMWLALMLALPNVEWKFEGCTRILF